MADSMDRAITNILYYLFDDSGKILKKPVIFVGSGVSREYGIPTSWGFAELFFKSSLSALNENEVKSLQAVSGERFIQSFIEEFSTKLYSATAYSFFKEQEKEALDKARTERSTYDWIISLWENDYIELIFTTNFDCLLEQTIKTKFKNFTFTVVDYNDLKTNEIPVTSGNKHIVKLAGDISRSQMLWTEQDFHKAINEPVKAFITRKSFDHPLLLLGYTASEKALRTFLKEHKELKVSVNPQELQEINTLNELMSTNKANVHVKTTASEFVQALYEKIYQRTLDERLQLSFERLKKIVLKTRIDITLSSNNTKCKEIARPDSAKVILDIFRQQYQESLLILHGRSGSGKSFMMEQAVLDLDAKELRVFVPAAEIIDSLDDWFSRFGQTKLSEVLNIVTFLDRQLIIIVDGLNEVKSLDKSLDILNEINKILDRLSQVNQTNNVKFIVTCRTDYWSNFENLSILKRPFKKEIIFPELTSQEIDTATKNLPPAVRNYLRYDPSIIEIFKTPQNLSSLLALEHAPAESLHEPDFFHLILEDLLQNSVKKLLVDKSELERNILEYCYTCFKCKSILISEFDISMAPEKVERLISIDLLKKGRTGIIQFMDERFGEFLFGYLLFNDYFVKTQLRKPIDILEECFKIINRKTLSPFNIHLTNSIIHFINELDSEAHQTLLQLNKIYVASLLRAATLRKGTIKLTEDLSKDSVYLAVAMMDSQNFDALSDKLMQCADYHVKRLPLNYGAKRYPHQCLIFFNYLLNKASQTKDQPLTLRQQSSLILDMAIATGLRLGFTTVLTSEFKSFIRDSDKCYMTDLIVESLKENTRSFFHNSEVDFIADMADIEWYWKNKLKKALRNGLFSLKSNDIIALMKHSGCVRLVMKFLFALDRDESKLKSFLSAVLATNSIQVFDTTFGLLGYLSKIDDAYFELAKNFQNSVTEKHSYIFEVKNDVNNSEDAHHQYDPLVPFATSILHNQSEEELLVFLKSSYDYSPYMVGRLSQKILLDFPLATINILNYYSASKQYSHHSEIRIAARALARFSANTFWENSSQQLREAAFSTTSNDLVELNRIVSQIRDYDWHLVLKDATKTDETKRITRAILYLYVNSGSLHKLVTRLVNAC